MFDVRRSSFKTIPYGINVTRERLQNNLALMGLNPQWNGKKAVLEIRNGDLFG